MNLKIKYIKRRKLKEKENWKPKTCMWEKRRDGKKIEKKTPVEVFSCFKEWERD